MNKKFVEKGDIWLANLNPSRKGELGKDSRPCIILQETEVNKILPSVVIIPLSTKKQKIDLEIKLKPNKINNLKKTSYVVWWHIYTINKLNLVRKVGQIENNTLIEISENIMDTLGFTSIFN